LISGPNHSLRTINWSNNCLRYIIELQKCNTWNTQIKQIYGLEKYIRVDVFICKNRGTTNKYMIDIKLLLIYLF
jgi:hypothetical protein